MADRQRVLFISPDAVGERMRGLGIRYTELARTLAADAEVVVATGDPGGGGAGPEGVRVVGYEPHAPAALRPEIAAADMIVAPPQWPLVSRWLRESAARIVIDLYCPETLETLAAFVAGRSVTRGLMNALTLDRLDDALRTGHHFVCAGEFQRDLWIGALLGQRLITPSTYDRDPSLREVLDLLPFGAPAQPPRAEGPGPRERFDQLEEGDELVLWNGGLWRWFDAATAVRAFALLVERRPQAKLVFMSGSTSVTAHDTTDAVRSLAASLGLLDSSVLFADSWVPYAQRASWLLDADCALAIGHDSLETRFAFRTRFLDCFWAGLPVVCTEGDELAERVARDDLGAIVPTGDHEAVAGALDRVLARGRAAYAGGLASAAASYAWPVVAAPLRRWLNASERPPRLSEEGRPPARRPAHLLRSASYRTARRSLELAHVAWPSL